VSVPLGGESRPAPISPEQRQARRLMRGRLLPDGTELAQTGAAAYDDARRLAGRLARLAPHALVALAGLVLVWTQTLGLEQSLWGDELHSVIDRIGPGPSGIFAHYIANDHMLFELLEWVTTGLSGDHAASAYRLWSILPTIAAAALMTWWLWGRLGRWIAAAFAVLLATSPMCLDLGPEGRGYGLGFLAGAMMVVGADRFAWRRTHGALALFAGGGLLGICTLPVIVLPFLGVAGVLLAQRALRRRVLYAVALVGGVSLLFYLPVVGGVLSNSSQQVGARLTWHGVITGPVRGLLAPNVSLLLGNAPVGMAEAIAAALLLLGLVALWRRPERLLALLLAAPALFTYLALKLGGFYVVDRFDAHAELTRFAITNRFTSYLLLPLLAAVAVALVELGRRATRRPAGAPVAAVCAAALSLLAFAQLGELARNNARLPLESYREVGAIVRDTGLDLTLTNSPSALGLRYYIDGHGRRVEVLNATQLEAQFCSSATGFVYVEHLLGAASRVDTTCLRQRGATVIPVPERRGAPMTIYILPKLPAGAASGDTSGSAGGEPRGGRGAPAA
jgi:hypothetical protein